VTRSLYVTAMEARSGKSLVALGLMELLSARVERLGFFRPIVPSAAEPDAQIELMRSRYALAAPYEELHALTEEEAGELRPYEELRKRVVTAYTALERRCDFVLCEGTDFGGATPALAFGLNADLANELGAPVLAVVRGRSPAETLTAVRAARASLAHKGCAVFGVVVTRVPEAELEAVERALAGDEGNEPVYVLPERAELACPTVGEVASALGATVVAAPGGALQREVREVVVAAAGAERFLDQLVDGALALVPGDRPDVLLAALAASVSPSLPSLSGIVLTEVAPPGARLRAMLADAPLAVLETEQPTGAAAAAAQGLQPLVRPEHERKIATALGAFESAVDTGELARRIALERPARTTPLMFEYELLEAAKAARAHVVLPEGGDERILRAAEILLLRDVVGLTILGDPAETKALAAALGVRLDGAELVDPHDSPLREEYAARYLELRRHRGMTEELAHDAVAHPNYFGTLMVHAGAADGMVSGAAHTTADTIRPAFEIIRAREGVSVVSSVFFMCLADRVLVYGDCAVNPAPDTDQLADIAISSAETAAAFGIEPLVAMLSYATGDSGRGESVDRVRAATEAVRRLRPDLPVEGPVQYDAAVDQGVARLKLPGSDVAGRATVLVFPDLVTGNVAYKAVQRSANAVAIGPILQGLRKPVNDLSRGCTVTDVVNTVAITAIQAGTRGLV
jgi:phosphate acetyltransferase